MIDKIRPFELLQLIRDKVVTNEHDLATIYRNSPSIFNLSVRPLLEAWLKLGWIEKAEDGDIKPTEHLLETQRALGLSLTQLAPYCDSSVVANPLFGRPKAPPKTSRLFVIMPFASELQAVYEDHIQAVAHRLDVSVARADDFFAANSIVSDVWNAIFRAQVLIADCTGRNPNVFYELGIAHTLGKPVIPIAQKKEDIPFDIQHIRTIIYDYTPRGMQDFEIALEETLKWEIRQPRTLADALDWEWRGSR